MDTGQTTRGSRGCLGWLIASGVLALMLIAAATVFIAVSSRDPNSTGYQILRVIRGEKAAEELATEIIIDRLAYDNKVPPADVAKLKRELEPISRELPALAEGEKHQLAMLIRKAMADGAVSDGELALIRGYARRSAADGDAEP